MTHLTPGEYDAELNGIRLHYTVRGSGPPLLAHSGGPGADARTWDAFAIVPLKIFNEEEAETFDLRPRLEEITVPTLILVGRHDFITNVAMVEEMAAHIPGAHLEIFEESGHFALVEEPQNFSRVIRLDHT